MVTPNVTLGTLALDGTDAYGVEWVCDPVQGWQGPASTLTVTQRARRDGGWGGTAYRSPRHIVLTGSIYAPTAALLTDALDRLNAAVRLSRAPLTVTEDAGARVAFVRRSGEVLAPLVTPQLSRYSVQLVAEDPRKFSTALTATTSLPSSTGGLDVPVVVPAVISETTVTGQVSLFNPGNTDGPVWLRVDNATGPVVTHVGSGRSLVFSTSLILGAGQFVTVDMDRHEVLEQGQSSRSGWVTGRGWSTFEPGWNTWSFAAASVTPGALLTITARPAWE